MSKATGWYLVAPPETPSCTPGQGAAYHRDYKRQPGHQSRFRFGTGLLSELGTGGGHSGARLWAARAMRDLGLRRLLG